MIDRSIGCLQAFPLFFERKRWECMRCTCDDLPILSYCVRRNVAFCSRDEASSGEFGVILLTLVRVKVR